MAPEATMTRFCGAGRKRGGVCKRPAGWGTDHPGTGTCKLHGGRTQAANTAAARRGIETVAVKLGQSLDVRPEELMLTCVRQAAGALQHATQTLAHHDGPLERDGRPVFVVTYHHEALKRASTISKMALDANIAERQVRLAERWAAMTAAAFEAALADSDIEAGQRAQLVRRFEARLIAAEQGGEAIEGTAR